MGWSRNPANAIEEQRAKHSSAGAAGVLIGAEGQLNKLDAKSGMVTPAQRLPPHPAP